MSFKINTYNEMKIKRLLPPPEWKLPVLILTAIFTGLGVVTIYMSKAWSYLSDKPSTCTNCHVMAPQYATWSHSAHREQATCNDCHVPHDYFVNTYYFKAKDGLRHATIFTLRNEPQVIFIKEDGAEVVHQNCIRCHAELLINPPLMASVDNHKEHRTDRKCWECHREVPHGRVNSLSSVPWARVPLPADPVPEWLKKKE